MENIAELAAIATAVSCISLWIHYIIEPGRIFGFIGKAIDKKYDKKKDSYPVYLQWFACNVCLTFWLSCLVSIFLYLEGGGEILAVIPFISHVLIRAANKFDI